MKAFTLLTAIGLFAVPGISLAQTVPADPQGCHGSHTVLAKNQTGDAGWQGTAIGGKGNSDGDATNGQVNEPGGRGGILQDFLANVCDLGSQN